jgi:transposase
MRSCSGDTISKRLKVTGTMESRLYPISQALFEREILPIILRKTTIQGGRPPKISHYICFCAMLTMLRCSLPWRDCPSEYGPWHTIYTRFKRWSENGLFWTILNEIKQKKLAEFRVIFIDSTTVKLHKHGYGSLKK